MFTGKEDVEATALRSQGWSISAIARHLGRSRQTIRSHLNGDHVAGTRRRVAPDPFEAFVPYVRARLGEDPHVWATALYDEVTELGFPLSYPSFTRALRARGLRPHCEACHGVKGRPTIEIAHPPAGEIQWDWNELPEPPWGGREAHLLLGSLPCSGRFRGVFSESEDQPHLIEAIDQVLRRLGGTAREWRFDRMATVVDPATGEVRASFLPVAKHYSVRVVACPPRRGNRKGSVEKSIHFATQRFWRTMTARTRPSAQEQFDRFCAETADCRRRPVAKLVELAGEEAAGALLAARGATRPSVADLAEFESLLALPEAPYPACVESRPVVGPSGLAAFEGNFYSVPHGLAGSEVTCRHRLGTARVELLSARGVLLASHRRARPGTGMIVRDPEHHRALEHDVLGAFSTAPPCREKQNRPPGPEARAEAAKLVRRHEDEDVVIDLSAYQALIEQTSGRFQGEQT